MYPCSHVHIAKTYMTFFPSLKPLPSESELSLVRVSSYTVEHFDDSTI